MKLFFQHSLRILIILMMTGCSRPISPIVTAVPISTASRNGLLKMVKTDRLVIWAVESDSQTARDIAAAVQANAEQICRLLETGCRFPVVVEVYPDQVSFDEHVLNPEMRGYFAISGPPHTIQMVSPLNPSPHKISYQDGVSVAVHEFVHLALDEVNTELPAWLDEGTAVFAGPHELYAAVCLEKFPFDLLPSFQQLQTDYNSVQAPDLFAYTAVDFIATEYGMKKLNRLLRTPAEMENILGIPQETFEDHWLQFIQAHCQNNSSSTISNP